MQSTGSHVHLRSLSTAKEIHAAGFLADSLPLEALRNGSYPRHGTHPFSYVSSELEGSSM